MHITQSYKYSINGNIYVGSNLPEEAIIIDTFNILNAEEGYMLFNKSNGENLGNSIMFTGKEDEYGEKLLEKEKVNMTVNKLISKLIDFGVEEEKINKIINDNYDILKDVDFNRTYIERKNPTLEGFCYQLDLNEKDIDKLFE